MRSFFSSKRTKVFVGRVSLKSLGLQRCPWGWIRKGW